MEYFELPGISQSMLKLMKVPIDYWYRYESGEYVDSSTKSLEFGTKLDMALFEPELFELNYQVLPGQKSTTKIGYIAEGEYSDVMQMIQAIKAQRLSSDSNTTLGDILPKARAQTILQWECPRTGLLRKGKPDMDFGNGDLFDLKSTEDASPEAFTRSAYKYGYHIQAADYLEGNLVQNGKKGSFFIIAVEKKAPFKTALYQFTPEFIKLGHQERDKLIDKYIECKNSNIWPGYGDDIIELNPPAWIK